MNAPETGEYPRAEELIAESYRQIRAFRDAGERPRRIVMSRRYWDIIGDYRRSLGVIAGPVPDYLSEDSLFGLEIWYGDGPGMRVE